jgi:hypothetical protein
VLQHFTGIAYSAVGHWKKLPMARIDIATWACCVVLNWTFGMWLLREDGFKVNMLAQVAGVL